MHLLRPHGRGLRGESGLQTRYGFFYNFFFHYCLLFLILLKSYTNTELEICVDIFSL